jgi:hypothetical protein
MGPQIRSPARQTRRGGTRGVGGSGLGLELELDENEFGIGIPRAAVVLAAARQLLAREASTPLGVACIPGNAQPDLSRGYRAPACLQGI